MSGWNVTRSDTTTLYQDPEGPSFTGYMEWCPGVTQPGTGIWKVDQAGNVTAKGITNLNGGSNTSSSAPVIASPGFSSGVASQLSDLTRDYMVYIRIGTGGGTVTLAIGPTSTPANTIMSSAVGINGELITVRLPAAWYLDITLATSTIASQIAIGC